MDSDAVKETRPRWYVKLGTHYIAGLGETFAGYQNKSNVARTPGLVITQLERRAMMFTSRREAAKLAGRIGGQVVKVDLT